MLLCRNGPVFHAVSTSRLRRTSRNGWQTFLLPFLRSKTCEVRDLLGPKDFREKEYGPQC